VEGGGSDYSIRKDVTRLWRWPVVGLAISSLASPTIMYCVSRKRKKGKKKYMCIQKLEKMKERRDESTLF
jgi:hypothetical protein